ncbi:hypothetical protein LPJ56_005746 [Coemansia sp. RSA 2599]|nr:hypothetical protein LPJ75_005742 [Coemansia sp. RSA 2598]KAJ1811688.1 hypothetical protein LPJ56_005746 [Coemansia sp. RSA 2599]
MPGTPVLVDPLDPEIRQWWPAVIVSKQEEEAGVVRHQVRYFEDGSYSDCLPSELLLFDIAKTTFDQSAFEDPAMRRAIAYYEWRFLSTPSSANTGVSEILRLRDHTDTESATLLDQSPMSVSCPPIQFEHFFQTTSAEPMAADRDSADCIRAYMHRMDEMVDIIDGRDMKIYRARILDMEFLCNEERLGLYYYVHYIGWNSKFDEWVPPSRLVYTV